MLWRAKPAAYLKMLPSFGQQWSSCIDSLWSGYKSAPAPKSGLSAAAGEGEAVPAGSAAKDPFDTWLSGICPAPVDLLAKIFKVAPGREGLLAGTQLLRRAARAACSGQGRGSRLCSSHHFTCVCSHGWATRPPRVADENPDPTLNQSVLLHHPPTPFFKPLSPPSLFPTRLHVPLSNKYRRTPTAVLLFFTFSLLDRCPLACASVIAIRWDTQGVCKNEIIIYIFFQQRSCGRQLLAAACTHENVDRQARDFLAWSLSEGCRSSINCNHQTAPARLLARLALAPRASSRPPRPHPACLPAVAPARPRRTGCLLQTYRGTDVCECYAPGACNC